MGLLLTIVALGLALGTLFNPEDDSAAYIYLAKRLASTGSLIDPFNLRRLTDYGGATLYQSIFLRVAGESSLHGFEFVFASLLLILIAVGTTRRRWMAAGTLLIGLGVLLGNDIGAVVNIGPNFSIAAFSLGLLYVLRSVRSWSERDEPFVYVVIGILLSGILALRFSFLVSMAITVLLVVVVLRRRQAVKPLLVIGITTVICSSGWAIALFRSSGTPMFPLIGGNYNKSWPSSQNPSEFARGFGRFAHFASEVFTADNLGWVALAGAIIGLGFLALSRWKSKEMLVLGSAGVGCLVQFPPPSPTPCQARSLMKSFGSLPPAHLRAGFWHSVSCGHGTTPKVIPLQECSQPHVPRSGWLATCQASQDGPWPRRGWGRPRASCSSSALPC